MREIVKKPPVKIKEVTLNRFELAQSLVAYRAGGGFGKETSDLVEMVMSSYEYHYDLESGRLKDMTGQPEEERYVFRLAAGAFNHWRDKVLAFNQYDVLIIKHVKSLWRKIKDPGEKEKEAEQDGHLEEESVVAGKEAV